MKDLLSNLLGIFAKSWWVEVSTGSPKCVYYFGPFESEAEAVQAQAGYIEDLKKEGAQQIQALVSRREDPPQLTVEYPETSAGKAEAALGNLS
ncbi:MAG: DUF1816 domain-containing protein [Leptolyngbya sp. SIO4C1]|nr:DUF1816 domain-containing protein [Leptolyngbya sp. SIO4C1]